MYFDIPMAFPPNVHRVCLLKPTGFGWFLGFTLTKVMLLVTSVVYCWRYCRSSFVIYICSMYGISTYIWSIFGVNIGIYTIHGAYGYRDVHSWKTTIDYWHVSLSVKGTNHIQVWAMIWSSETSSQDPFESHWPSTDVMTLSSHWLIDEQRGDGFTPRYNRSW